MILNLVLLLIGAVFLVYGIRKKLKFWIVVGAVLLGLALASVGMDFLTGGAVNETNDINYRLPFVIGGAVR